MNATKELSKLLANQGLDMFLRNFSKIPDDKLDWKPTPTAKSALQVAAHVAVTNANFARFIRNRAVPSAEEVESFVAETTAKEAAITTREEMERVLRANTEEFIEAVEGLSDEDVESVIDSGQGWTMSMKYMMRIAGWHLTLHTGQIDYIQTCYGDSEIYTG